MRWPTGTKIPKAIQMIGRNCGIYTEDDLLLNPEGDGRAVVGDSDSPANCASGMATARCALTVCFSCLTLIANVLYNAGQQLHRASFWKMSPLGHCSCALKIPQFCWTLHNSASWALIRHSITHIHSHINCGPCPG